MWQVKPDGEFLVEPQRILDKREIMLQKRAITQVKVQWKHFSPDEATWEDEGFTWKAYPELFSELKLNIEDGVNSRGEVVTTTLLIAS